MALLAGDETGVHELVETGNINLRHPLPHDPDHKYPLHCAGESYLLSSLVVLSPTIVWLVPNLVL